MNGNEFLKFYESLVEEETKIYKCKGTEYSGVENRFKNFEDLAGELNLHPLDVLWVYARKHYDSIKSFWKEKKVFSNEDIIGRINDFRNYLALGAGMITKYRLLPKEHPWRLEPFVSNTTTNDKTKS